MRSTDIYDITIIGAGPVGLFAAFYAGMRNMKSKVIEALSQSGGQITVLYPEKFIYDVPGFFKILASDLVNNLLEQGSRFGTVFCFNEKVLNLRHLEKNLIHLTTNVGEHYSRTVLICGGIGAFRPKKLNIPGIEKFEDKGVYYWVKDRAGLRGKRVLIIGGGDSALDWAINLEHWCKEVTLIHRRDVFRAHENTVTALFSSDVKVKLFHELTEVHGEALLSVKIINNKTNETMLLDVDAILVFVGYETDIGTMKQWGLQLKDNHILVNGRMETNLPGVYAAGDITYPRDSVRLSLICVGFAQAAIAVNCAKNLIDPTASIHPGRSSHDTVT